MSFSTGFKIQAWGTQNEREHEAKVLREALAAAGQAFCASVDAADNWDGKTTWYVTTTTTRTETTYHSTAGTQDLSADESTVVEVSLSGHINLPDPPPDPAP